jgi:hypothetical protein
LGIGPTAGFFLLLLGCTALAASTYTYKVRIEQFGYPADATEVAAIADPQIGWNSAESYSPGATLEVRW